MKQRPPDLSWCATFFLQEAMDVAGAPERPSHGAFLFKRSSE